jgi:glucose-6-phosphate 1-dehydrogenase
LDYWRQQANAGMLGYPAGSWGPAAADGLLAPRGHTWREP